MRIKNIVYILFVVVLGLSACSERFLDLKPSDSENAAGDFNDSIKVEAFMTGIYDRAQWSNFTLHLILHSEVKGEDVFVVSSGNYGRFVSSYQYSEDPFTGSQNDLWSNGYTIIANCNQIISKLPNATDLSEGLRNHYLAEARAIRANTYFQLVRLFGQPYGVAPNGPGVPLTLAPLAANDDFPGRSTVSEVYTEILNDLQFAETNFNPGQGSSIYRITSPAIDGLLARVYLNMGNWNEASSYADSVITQFPLMSAGLLAVCARNE